MSTSVRQDDDHTITLEATQDMLFMSPEGLPSEGDIAQMTQVHTHKAASTCMAEENLAMSLYSIKKIGC